MAKIIAVIGPPASGKTTVAMKLSQEVYCGSESGAVIFLSPSLTVPALGYLFPNYTPDSVCSIGDMLDKTDIYEEDILSHLVTVKNMKNFGCLGYKAGDNKYKFAKITDDKVKELFIALKKIAGYVFIDCTNDDSDLISQIALREADEVIMVLTPDIKSLVYLSSTSANLGSKADTAYRLLNNTQCDLFFPFAEFKAQVSNISFVLPYSRAVKEQMLNGVLYEMLNDKKYLKELKLLAKTII